MNIKDFPFLIQRRLTNEVRGFLLKHGLTGTCGLDLRFLFTTSHGVFFYDRGKIKKLIDLPHFGITSFEKDTIIVARRVASRDSQKSGVFSYHFDGEKFSDRKEIKFHNSAGTRLQPFGIHQLRVLNGYLWVTNTRENVVWKCTLDGTVLVEWTEEGKMPFDESDLKKSNALRKNTLEYRHYNSITYHDNHYYILAHNCTQDHGDLTKKSYIVKLDEQLKIVEKITEEGRACHDLLFIDESLFICNSREGSLMKDGQPILQLNAFLRGLGKIGSIMMVGGSQFEVNRSARESSVSRLFFVDYPAERLLLTIELGRVGNILDILILE